jgi:hypothetical protein
MPFSRAAGRQAIFLGTTEPRAARPESPAAGSVVGQGQLVLSTAGEAILLDAHLRRTTSRRNGFSYWRDVARCAHHHVTDTRQRSGGVEKYSSIASRQAPEHGSTASSCRPDSRMSAAILSAQSMQTPARSIPQPVQLQLDL